MTKQVQGSESAENRVASMVDVYGATALAKWVLRAEARGDRYRDALEDIVARAGWDGDWATDRAREALDG